MAIIGRLHPLIVHFPIALVMLAAVLEVGAIPTRNPRWRTAAVFNVRAGAALAVPAAIAGWLLASAPGTEAGPLLEWHRWLGATATLATVVAAITTLSYQRSPARHLLIYRAALFGAASLVAASGHLGGLLVWGADFLRP